MEENILNGIQNENDFKKILTKWKDEIIEAKEVVFDWTEEGLDGLQEVHGQADFIDKIYEYYGFKIGPEIYSKIMDGLDNVFLIWKVYKHLRNIYNTVTDSGDYVIDRALKEPPSDFEEAFQDLSDFIQMGSGFGLPGFLVDKGLELGSYLIDAIWEFLPSSKKKIREVFGYDNDVIDIVYEVGKKRNTRATRDQDITREDYDRYNEKISEWKPAFKNVHNGKTEEVLQNILAEKNKTESIIQGTKEVIQVLNDRFNEIAFEHNSVPFSNNSEPTSNGTKIIEYPLSIGDFIQGGYEYINHKSTQGTSNSESRLTEEEYLGIEQYLMKEIKEKNETVDQSEAWLRKVKEYLALYEYLKKAEEEKKSQYRQGAPYKDIPKALQAWKGNDKQIAASSKGDLNSAKSIIDLINEKGDGLSYPQIFEVISPEDLPRSSTRRFMKDMARMEGNKKTYEIYSSQAIGTTNAGNLFLAGEEGPELVVGAGGSRVFTAGETKNIISRAYENSFSIDPRYGELLMQKQKEKQQEREKASTSVSKTIKLDIGGYGAIKVDRGISEGDLLELVRENLSPILVDVLSREVFEEGDGSYDY
jgi:hypothetical protein